MSRVELLFGVLRPGHHLPGVSSLAVRLLSSQGSSHKCGASEGPAGLCVCPFVCLKAEGHQVGPALHPSASWKTVGAGQQFSAAVPTHTQLWANYPIWPRLNGAIGLPLYRSHIGPVMSQTEAKTCIGI